MDTITNRPQSREYETPLDFTVLDPANIGRMIADEETAPKVAMASIDIIQRIIVSDEGLGEDILADSGLAECVSRDENLSENDYLKAQLNSLLEDLAFLPELISDVDLEDRTSTDLLIEKMSMDLIDVLIAHVKPHEFSVPPTQSAHDKVLSEVLQPELPTIELDKSKIGWISAEKDNPEVIRLVVDTTPSGKRFAWANIISLARKTRKMFDDVERGDQPVVIERTLAKINAAVDAGESQDRPAYSKDTIQFEGNFNNTDLPVYKARGIFKDMRAVVLRNVDENGEQPVGEVDGMPVFLVTAAYRKTKQETENREIYEGLLGGRR